MMEATGATRHIHTAAAVAARHEMTPDTLTNQAAGYSSGGKINK